MSSEFVSNFLDVLQMTDTAFPTGAFSHSIGLEAAIQLKYTKNRDDFRTFVGSMLENAGSKYLPIVSQACESQLSVSAMAQLDHFCDSCMVNHVEKRASLRQGHSFLETASKTFSDRPHLSLLYQRLQTGSCLGHLPVVYGAVCGCLGISLAHTQQLFLYTCLKTVVAAAVRLGHLGAMEAQQIQYKVQGHIPDIIERNKDKTLEEICTRNPVIDIIQNVQDTLFSKLFYS